MLTAVKPNPAVSQKVLSSIQSWINSGVSLEDWLPRLRLQMVPAGYVAHTWTGACI